MAKKQERYRDSITHLGYRINIFEQPNSKNLHFSLTLNGSRERGSLGTPDKVEAQAAARAVVDELVKQDLNGGPAPHTSLESITLAEMFALYRSSREKLVGPKWKRASEARCELFEEAWGADHMISAIDDDSLDLFVHNRLKGEVGAGPVRPGTVESDLRWLGTVFRWAMRHKVGKGSLINSNPLFGYQGKPEAKNVRRPRASQDRYMKTLGKCDEVDPTGRLRCMLHLARFTGRRVNAICSLRGADVLRTAEQVEATLAAFGLDPADSAQFPSGGLVWRAASDKQGMISVMPISSAARAALDAYTKVHPALGEAPLFPSPRKPSETIRADQAGRWLRKAEKLAGLLKLSGGLWHPYRRLFATDLRSLPVQDVAKLGGWKSVELVQALYQQAPMAGVLNAAEEIGKLA